MARVNRRPGLQKRLNRLFRKYDISIRHKLAGSNVDYRPSERMIGEDFGYMFRQSFNQAMNNIPQYDRIARACISGDTKIATPSAKGYETIEDLVKMYPNGEKFWVFAYDKSEDEVKCVQAEFPHYTKTSEVVKLITDHGSLICTPDHRIMLRNGEYKEAKDLVEGEALMPFYRKEFKGKEGYRHIYGFSRNKKTGELLANRTSYVPEYIIVRESIDKARYGKNSGFHVHHKDFNKQNDLPENLEVMTPEEHKYLHAEIINGKRWSKPEEHEKMSRFMKEFSSSESGKIIRENARKTKKYIESHRKVCIDRNTTNPPGVYNKGREDQKLFDNANCDDSFTFQDICNAYEPKMTMKSLYTRLNKTESMVLRRIRWAGYENYKDFKQRYENCKVVRVEKLEGTMPVYDLTVPGLHNFAILDNSAKSLMFISNSDHEEMDNGIIATALTIYAQESATYFEDGQVLHVSSKDKHIEQILNSLFYEVLNIEANIHFWVRNLCKYGDAFFLLDITEDNGVVNIIPVPTTDIEREENYDEKNPFSVRFKWVAGGNKILEPWQVIHLRLLGNHRYLPYGTSKIDAARRVWRQISLFEDAMLLYRIVRAPSRKIFKVDVGGIKPTEVDNFMKKYIDNIRRTTIVNATNSTGDKRLDPLDVTEDFFIPVRGGESGTDITELPGSTWGTDMEDLEYLNNKMIATLGIPRAYLSFDEVLQSKNNLQTEDVRFSRAVQQIQRAVVAELSRIAIIHLYVMGYEGHKLIDFNIELNPPSSIYELQKLELWRTRMEIAQMIPEAYKLPRNYVYKHIYNLTEGDFNEFKADFIQEKLDNDAIEGGGQPGAEGTPGAGGEPTTGEGKGGELTPSQEEPVKAENKVGEITKSQMIDVIHDQKNIEASVENKLEEEINKYDRYMKTLMEGIDNKYPSIKSKRGKKIV